MVDDICRLTAAALSAKLRDGEITAEQLARTCLARIAAREADVRAWSYVDPDAVIRQARELDKLPSRGPLHGIPVGVKDIYNTADMPTQHNSPIYTGHRPNADAATVGTLRAAGALILGKTDTMEFASTGRCIRNSCGGRTISADLRGRSWYALTTPQQSIGCSSIASLVTSMRC